MDDDRAARMLSEKAMAEAIGNAIGELENKIRDLRLEFENHCAFLERRIESMEGAFKHGPWATFAEIVAANALVNTNKN